MRSVLPMTAAASGSDTAKNSAASLRKQGLDDLRGGTFATSGSVLSAPERREVPDPLGFALRAKRRHGGSRERKLGRRGIDRPHLAREAIQDAARRTPREHVAERRVARAIALERRPM